MESYTSDSSDSDSNSNKCVDYSYLMLDTESINNYLHDALSSEKVQTLLLHHNRFLTIPDNIKRFQNLNTLDVSSCNLEILPDVLTKLPLVCLVAKNNLISNNGLPKSFEGLNSLRELNLSGNRLNDFPGQVLDLVGLKFLYLGGNRINEIVQDIWRLQR